MGQNSFTNVTSVILQRASSLQTLVIEDHSFYGTEELTVTGASNLTQVQFGSLCFTNATTFVLEAGVKLNSFTVSDSAFQQVKTVDLSGTSSIHV